MLRFSSVQRRKILNEAGFLPYLGGKNPFNPITPEPVVAGATGHSSGLDFPPDADDQAIDQEGILDKVIAVIKLLVGENYSEEEIRQEALKILRSYDL